MLRYLDSSALVKLVVAEPESARLSAHLDDPDDQAVCSALCAVEVPRAVVRAGLGEKGMERVTAVLSAVELRQVDREIIGAAAELEPTELRSLDAIHLATALELAGELAELVAYDRWLLAAAERHGLTAVSP